MPYTLASVFFFQVRCQFVVSIPCTPHGVLAKLAISPPRQANPKHQVEAAPMCPSFMKLKKW